MDFFGIGQAMTAMVNLYSITARRTGRTTAMINSLKDGDRVIFINSQEAHRVNRLCKQKGIDVKCEVVNPKLPSNLFNRPPSQKRTIFDHSWVEEYYKNAIEKAQQEIKYFEIESGGYGESHEKTKEKYSTALKWIPK